MNKLAIDFGNSNTVLSLWKEDTQEAVLLDLPESVTDNSFLIPSVIRYTTEGNLIIGADAMRNRATENSAFRWMKRCISLRSPYALRVGGEKINAARAAEDFLNQLLLRAQASAEIDFSDLTFSVPTESFEDYSEWLLSLGNRRGAARVRLIDEAAAAALGCGLSLHPGDLLMIFDFGGSTMQSVCVKVAEEASEGHCCKVLAKTGLNIGGSTLDRWIYEEALKKAELSEGDLRLRPFTAELLKRCETLKIQLSEREFSTLELFGEGITLRQSWTREELSRIFYEHGLPFRVQELLNEMEKQLFDLGIVSDKLRAILPVGGSCLIPLVQECLAKQFPEKLITSDDPLGAVARGAAIFAGGAHIYDTIAHEYSLRYRKPDGTYGFHPLIPAKTPFPSPDNLKVVQIKGAFPDQRALGLAIYERSNEKSLTDEKNEICFEEDGSVRILPRMTRENDSRGLFWLNEKAPLFLTADPPAVPGEPCFRLAFSIDENKILRVTATDTRKNEIVLDHTPVIRLN